MSSADDIAKVVADLKHGRIRFLEQNVGLWRSFTTLFNIGEMPVIDATRIYKSVVESEGIMPYEDHVLRPPWMDALICYVNDHGNVHVMHTMCSKADDHVALFVEPHYQPSDQDHVIEWERVAWIYTISAWCGGYSHGRTRPMPTAGPIHAWVVPVYGDNGMAADIRWIQLTDPETSTWDNNMLVVLQTINFMNCVNVELAEPHRDRMQRKRIRRYLGETELTEIRVRPVSKTYASGEHYDHKDFLVPLHSVRGHMAHYGPEYGRKLLFGKYAGRFWIQQHVRGTEALGKREHKYIPEPEDD